LDENDKTFMKASVNRKQKMLDAGFKVLLFISLKKIFFLTLWIYYLLLLKGHYDVLNE